MKPQAKRRLKDMTAWRRQHYQKNRERILNTFRFCKYCDMECLAYKYTTHAKTRSHLRNKEAAQKRLLAPVKSQLLGMSETEQKRVLEAVKEALCDLEVAQIRCALTPTDSASAGSVTENIVPEADEQRNALKENEDVFYTLTELESAKVGIPSC